MKIGIFGGSFNPPTKMHLLIAEKLIKEKYVDKIIYVPTGKIYKYKNNLIADKYRYQMLKIMTQNNKNILVSDYELKPYEVYTYQTLKHFQNKYKNDTIYFICGSDNLSYINKWKNALEIMQNYKILVIKREGYSVDDILSKLNEYKDNIIITKVKEKNISSTLARNYIAQKDFQKLNKVIDERIIDYIIKNKLY